MQDEPGRPYFCLVVFTLTICQVTTCGQTLWSPTQSCVKKAALYTITIYPSLFVLTSLMLQLKLKKSIFKGHASGAPSLENFSNYTSAAGHSMHSASKCCVRKSKNVAFAYSTEYSQAVTHPSTNSAQRRLT